MHAQLILNIIKYLLYNAIIVVLRGFISMYVCMRNLF